MTRGDHTGGGRCWPCTVANSAVGLGIAWLPLAAALADGSTATVVGAVLWGVVVTGYTGYRLVRLGYLPFAEPVAKRTGLHERVDPQSQTEANRDDERRDG